MVRVVQRDVLQRDMCRLLWLAFTDCVNRSRALGAPDVYRVRSFGKRERPPIVLLAFQRSDASAVSIAKMLSELSGREYGRQRRLVPVFRFQSRPTGFQLAGSGFDCMQCGRVHAGGFTTARGRTEDVNLVVDQDGAVLSIRINRPDVRNAFDDETISELTRAFREVPERVRAVVLSGEGQVFCAGGDLNWMRRTADYTEEENLRDAEALAGLFLAVDECPCPVVARVQGAAFGGGLGLVSVSDIVIAEEGAKFCFSEVKLGLVPSVISQFALRKIGESAARRYFLTAEVFDAREAQRIGLVHRIVPFDRLDQEVDVVVGAILANGPQAVRSAKALIRQLRGKTVEEAISLSTKTIAQARASEEGKEGVAAFLEKRKPSWQE
jgi:methylglutaconyl-CoA hydratase